MPRMPRRLFSQFVLVLAASAIGAAAQAACLPDGVQSSGAKYRICMPDAGRWNGNLVIYAHGYVAFNEPIAIPEDQLTLPDGTSLPTLVNALGYAFAVSSYSTNGLAVLQGIADLSDLVGIFSRTVGQPGRIYLAGPSEGGIITALSIERLPQIYNAALAACGAIGSFRQEINYIGDFRVLFDYFFPGVIPGDAVSVPAEVIANWDAVYVPNIRAAIKANPAATAQLLNVANAPVGADPSTVEETVVGVLWYAVFSTNDAVQKLDGHPFDNAKKYYHGSLDDARLNLLVKRFSADPQALTEMTQYETSGVLSRPLVTIHTVGDQILPYWHEPLYRLKTIASGTSGEHVNIPVFRYGHCNFNTSDILLALGLVILKDAGQGLPGTVVSLVPQLQRADFVSRARTAGLLQ